MLVSVVCSSRYADAAIFPNPGGPVVVTNSTTETITYINTTVTQRVDAFSTTLRGLVNGSPVFSQTYSSPFSDPVVQAAVIQADSVLSGAGASFGGPKLIASSSLLQSSLTTPPPTFSCIQLTGGPPGTTVVGATVDTPVNTFGPNTIAVSTCSLDTFVINSGQLDINVNTNLVYAVPRNIVTTNTFLTTQSYDILGTTSAPAGVPEPSPAALVFLGLGAVVRLRPSQFGFSRQ